MSTPDEGAEGPRLHATASLSQGPALSLPPSPTRLIVTAVNSATDMSVEADIVGLSEASERDPLLRPHSSKDERPHKKPFYRPRPLWIVPFAIAASISRGMTTAPRVEVFTQLACIAVHGPLIDYNHTVSHSTINLAPNYASITNSHLTYPAEFPVAAGEGGDDDDDDDDPMHLPSKRCLTDPVVQAKAARLQTMMTTTMGALSAMTTGWWGHFGQRHGRTRVLAVASFSLMITDITFLLVSAPHSPFSGHGHKLLIVAPVIEGLLGGWATLHAATFSYISDCTSDGSRAHIFSRFTGVFYVGFAMGPMIGAYLISHSSSLPVASTPSDSTVAPVFWVASLCSLINFFLSAFVFPESLNKRKLQTPTSPQEQTQPTDRPSVGPIKGFLKPLAILIPKKINTVEGGYRRDWSLTLLLTGLFCFYLAMSLFQIKYLYAKHVFGWGAEQLSYYISFVGGFRAVTVLLLLPFIISIFKPRISSTQNVAQSSTSQAGKKPKLTRSQLLKEISFDLRLVRLSFMVDLLSHTLVSLSSTAPTTAAQAFFVGFTCLSSLSTGALPAIQSLSLCILQLRDRDDAATGDTGSLFGAMAMLQAIGQMIIGPTLFGLVYSTTVARFPKAIFVVAAGLMTVALTLMFMVRPPIRKPKAHREEDGTAEEVERGRSRISKDLSRHNTESD